MSSINPQNINGNYPIAGQDNDSQGFRDNFTNIKNNLDLARVEINDLQTNAVLKGALAGTTLNNDLNNSQVKKAQILQSTETYKDLGTLSGAISVSWIDGHYQVVTVAAGGAISVNFTNWPTSGFFTKLRLQVITTNVSASPVTLTLPGQVSINTSNIQGASGQVITLPANGTYVFEFTTRDGGGTIIVEDVLRNYNISGTSTSFSTANVTSNLASTSSSTGALLVAGGVGIAGDLNVGGNISSTGYIANHVTTYTLSIGDNGSGTQTVFYIDGVKLKSNAGVTSSALVQFYPGEKYRFESSNVSLAGNQLKFSTTPDTEVPASITPYTTNVVQSDILPGNAGAYTDITITNTTPNALYLYIDGTDAISDTSLTGAALPIPVASRSYLGPNVSLDNATITGNIAIGGSATITGNIVLGGAQIETGYQYSDAVTGFNDTVGASIARVIYDPAGPLANGTVTLPVGNVDAKVVTISSTANIANLQVLPAVGTTLVPSANVNLIGGTSVTYFYKASELKWLKIG